jgi:hypothetical protein
MSRPLRRALGAAALLLAGLCGAHAADGPITLQVPATLQAPGSPLGHGYNTAFFERGLSDALNDPATGHDLAATLRAIHATALRFPGGSFTYWYPHLQQGLEAFKRAGFAEESYNLWWPDKYGWGSEEAFLSLCQEAGLTAWYEINPAYVYDAERDAVGQLAEMPRRGVQRGAVLDPARYLPMALERLQGLARWCLERGVPVVWEVGNEDYVYFEPAGYAHVAAAFMGAIREVDPQARFCLCGDSESWSTRDWQTQMLAALRQEGITSFDFASVHCYLTGVGEFDAQGVYHAPKHDTGADTYRSTVRAWQLIRNMYQGEYRRILDEAGFAATQFAFTEFSAIHGAHVGPELAARREHCMGRALGEATIHPFCAADSGAWFSHDLVRGGPGTGDFFRRLDYTPAGKTRYGLTLEARVMGLVALHCQGQVLSRDWSGICASAHPWGLYLTAVNAEGTERTVTFQLPEGAKWARFTTECLNAADLDSVDYEFDFHQWPGPQPEGDLLTVRVPPYAISAVSALYAHQ